MNEEKTNTTIIEIKIPTPNDFQVKDAVDRALLNLKQINELILQNSSEIYIRELLNRVEQLQNNWKELKKMIEEKRSLNNFSEENRTETAYYKLLRELSNKIEKLEQGKDE